MRVDTPKRHVERLLKGADVAIDGNRPWDIRVHEDSFYARVLAHGSVGLGESFMDGWWDAPSLERLLDHLLRAGLDRQVRLDDAWIALRARLLNLQRGARSFAVAHRHYDLGNDL
jgi:cyclopropane-fatty-acyl-phospholipid synthase